MLEDRTTGPSGIAPPVPDLPTSADSTGAPISKQVIDQRFSGTEPATRQAVDVEISSLRTHLDDCLSAVNAKLDSAEALFKAKLDNVEIRLNARIDLLNKDVQGINDKRKKKKDRRWDILILFITIVATIAATLAVEKWIIPLLKK